MPRIKDHCKNSIERTEKTFDIWLKLANKMEKENLERLQRSFGLVAYKKRE